MGIALAVALVTILFHHHNQKSGTVLPVLSARASYKQNDSTTEDHRAKFGILKKTQSTYINSWVFGPQLHCTLPQVDPNELTEVHLSPDIEDIVSISDIFETLQSAVCLHQLSRNLYKVSNHSPLLNQKMIPFMSSVTCLFEPVDSPVSEHEQHQNRLTDIVESWGFQLHPVPGDGNCCFYALAFSIHAQCQDIEQKLPQLFADLGTGLADIAHQLRRIAVDEWMNHQDEYQHYLDGEHKVADEAPAFLQNRYFFGPLGNTMVVAISNSLGLPIIIFSSASHYPIISIAPRACRASLPLYIAFNQAGPGHYDAVSFKSTSNLSPPPQQPGDETNPSRCTCGKGNKHYSTSERCKIMQYKYTTSIRCPCLLAGQPCTYKCTCHNCANPKGIRPKVTSRVREQRKRHAWNLKPTKSVIYAHQEQENVLTGPRTQLEYFLILQILRFCRQNHIDTSLDTVHEIYLSCVELAQALDIYQPLGPKRAEEITKIMDEYESHRKVFEATCIAQLKINNS